MSDALTPVASPQARAVTLGAQLERIRLERRAQQLERVLRRLRARAGAADACERERSGLQRAVADFGHELHEVRQRLGHAEGDARRVRAAPARGPRSARSDALTR